MDVDLKVLTDDELRLAFDELCDHAGEDEEPEARRAWHDALMEVTQELGRRTDAWIAERQRA